ncbi:MAG TPA: hydroxysqualene dehydroxylase HpnE [Burkholderiaceae bacterium]|nr:hydroxysqualene dehydroxylase HpnE [Burkholderiaceae bacterium]
MSHRRLRVGVVGAGWAGLAAAVQAVSDGHAVTLLEMARQGGGRARSVAVDQLQLDNGQHILIGAYSETLRLMRLVGVDPAKVLQRRTLELVYPDGSGLRLPRGNVHLAFAWAVLRVRRWTWSQRWSLLARTLQWLRNDMRNPGVDTVARLCAGLPAPVRADLIDPLCIAALNTPATQASATVFLRVLADALFGGPGSSDLLLPTAGLSSLFPQPALRWLEQHGATVRLGHRVQALDQASDAAWSIDAESFDAVVLACSATEAARLTAQLNPAWSALTSALSYEPIATVYLRSSQPLPSPMVALESTADQPAQFAFDLERLGQHRGVAAFVISGARRWLDDGLPALAGTVQRQAARALPGSFGDSPAVVHTALERRATFACVPALARPAMAVAPGLFAAADYVEGPYPATLEGAVRAGVRAGAAAKTVSSRASRMQNLVP